MTMTCMPFLIGWYWWHWVWTSYRCHIPLCNLGWCHLEWCHPRCCNRKWCHPRHAAMLRREFPLLVAILDDAIQNGSRKWKWRHSRWRPEAAILLLNKGSKNGSYTTSSIANFFEPPTWRRRKMAELPPTILDDVISASCVQEVSHGKSSMKGWCGQTAPGAGWPQTGGSGLYLQNSIFSAIPLIINEQYEPRKAVLYYFALIYLCAHRTWGIW